MFLLSEFSLTNRTLSSVVGRPPTLRLVDIDADLPPSSNHPDPFLAFVKLNQIVDNCSVTLLSVQRSRLSRSQVDDSVRSFDSSLLEWKEEWFSAAYYSHELFLQLATLYYTTMFVVLKQSNSAVIRKGNIRIEDAQVDAARTLIQVYGDSEPNRYLWYDFYYVSQSKC